MTYIFDSYNIINLQVKNIINFPLCITSSRTYSLNPGLYPATIRSRGYPRTIRLISEVGHSRTVRLISGTLLPASEAGPLPNCSADIRSQGHSRTVRSIYEAGLLPDCPNDPRSRAALRLSGHYPKSGFSRAVRLIPKSGYHSLPRLRKALIRSASYEIRAPTHFPHPDSSGATARRE